jgi:predicted ABC-type ATPase
VATPVLHLLVGPNGAGKTTFYERVLGPATGLPFINADLIAAARWPDEVAARAYDAAALAAEERRAAIASGRSFASETVFSHPSKLELLRLAAGAGYRCYLHVILIPEELAVARVAVRVQLSGHAVPEGKIRARFRRLWGLVRQAIAQVDEAQVLDNARAATPFRVVARYAGGAQLGPAAWPTWTPPELRGESP